VTAGGPARTLDGGAWTQEFVMDDAHAEPRGYLAGTQTLDNIIHIISSRLHYRFNLAWIKAAMPTKGTADDLRPANAQPMTEPKRNPTTNGAERKNDRPVSLPGAKRPKVENGLIYQPSTESPAERQSKLLSL
jgi:hypothetical protein